MSKIKSFTDLEVWKKAHQLVLEIYKTVSQFPKEEIYGLSSQIKRSSVSIPSNIAEGFVRKGKKEKIQFYYIALGSVTELKSQLLIAKDLKFVQKKAFQKLANLTIEVSKLIVSLIKSTNNR